MADRTLSEYEKVQLRWQELQIKELEEKMQARAEEREREAARRRRQLEDFEKNQDLMLRRQRRCKHRKGGRNNNFLDGNDNNYSVVKNTYPNGLTVIMCTRCLKEVPKPDPRDRKKNPRLYAERVTEWNVWEQMPTDNSPSGGKIFEIIPAAA